MKTIVSIGILATQLTPSFQLVQNEQCTEGKFAAYAKQVMKREFSCCYLGKNCCGGEFFAGKAGFFATQVGRSTWAQVPVLH